MVAAPHLVAQELVGRDHRRGALQQHRLETREDVFPEHVHDHVPVLIEQVGVEARPCQTAGQKRRRKIQDLVAAGTHDHGIALLPAQNPGDGPGPCDHADAEVQAFAPQPQSHAIPARQARCRRKVVARARQPARIGGRPPVPEFPDESRQ